MKNLFSNILNKKHKEINKKEKVELKVNEMKEKTNETRQLPTGQAIDYLNKSTIIQDYKGNIIAEYLYADKQDFEPVHHHEPVKYHEHGKHWAMEIPEAHS